MTGFEMALLALLAMLVVTVASMEGKLRMITSVLTDIRNSLHKLSETVERAVDRDDET